MFMCIYDAILSDPDSVKFLTKDAMSNKTKLKTNNRICNE